MISREIWRKKTRANHRCLSLESQGEMFSKNLSHSHKIIDIVISSSWIIEFLKCVWSEYRIIFIYLFQPFRLVTVCYPSTPPLWRLWCFDKRPPPTYTFKRHILLFRLNKSCIKWNLTFKVWLKCFISVESIYLLDLW